jgi:ABC-type nickel/cobalt efflux system permease component RcnA
MDAMRLLFKKMPKSIKKWFGLSAIAFLLSLCLSTFWTLPTFAHADDLSVAHLRIKPQVTRINLTLPTSLIAFADRDRNSQLSQQEIIAHRQQLQNYFRDRLRLSDSQGREGTVTVAPAGRLLLPPTLLGSNTHSTIALTYTWTQPINKLKIDYDLFDNLPNAHCLTTIYKNGSLDNYIFTPSNKTLEVELQTGVGTFIANNSLIAIAVAFAWGAAHALSPGHGKTLVGAYLVGSRADAKHALFLGLTTTITHTIGVFALGIVALLASQYFMPAAFFPWMSLLSGLMVVALGFNLLRKRLLAYTAVFAPLAPQFWGGKPQSPPDLGDLGGTIMVYSTENRCKRKSSHHHHSHSHDHSHHGHSHSHHHHDHSHSHHDHSHSHHDHSHSHHDHSHSHSHLPSDIDGDSITWRSLIALGIAGGLVPCPAALVLLLSTIAIGQIGFGLLLVSVFSLGLAGSLTVLGLLLVNTKSFFNSLPIQFKNPKILSLVGALGVLLIGSGLTYQAILQIQSQTVPVVALKSFGY